MVVCARYEWWYEKKETVSPATLDSLEVNLTLMTAGDIDVASWIKMCSCCRPLSNIAVRFVGFCTKKNLSRSDRVLPKWLEVSP